MDCDLPRVLPIGHSPAVEFGLDFLHRDRLQSGLGKGHIMKKILGGFVVSALLAAPVAAADLAHAGEGAAAGDRHCVRLDRLLHRRSRRLRLGQEDSQRPALPLSGAIRTRPRCRWHRRRRSGGLQSLAARPLGVRHRRPGVVGGHRRRASGQHRLRPSASTASAPTPTSSAASRRGLAMRSARPARRWSSSRAARPSSTSSSMPTLRTRHCFTVGQGPALGLDDWRRHRARAQQQLVDQGRVQLQQLRHRTIGLCTPADVCDDFSVKQHVHLVKFGINYRFGGPVVARY